MVSETPSGPEFLGFSYFPIIGTSWFPFCLLSYFTLFLKIFPLYAFSCFPFSSLVNIRTDRGFSWKKSCPALLHFDQKSHTKVAWGLLSWIQGPRSPGLQIMGKGPEGTSELAPSSPFQFLRVLTVCVAPSCVQTELFHCRVPSIFFPPTRGSNSREKSYS